jgi:hypothetical protein
MGAGRGTQGDHVIAIYGYGDGDGDGYGHGDGSGDGHGYGDGHGDGYGYGAAGYPEQGIGGPRAALASCAAREQIEGASIADLIALAVA